MEIWHSQLDVGREALRNAGASAADLAAIGITNQRETTVLWNRATGRPLAPDSRPNVAKWRLER